MASRRAILTASMEHLPGVNDPLRELFETCKTGDIARVRKLVNSQTVNARDTAGRKSTPLHFAAGEIETQVALLFPLITSICHYIPNEFNLL